MENSKKVVDGALAAFNQYSEATAEGKKLSWMDLWRLGPIVATLGPAVGALGKAGQEWEDASDVERADLIQYVRVVFKLPKNEALEAKVEAGVSIAVKAGGIVNDVKVLFAKDAKPVPASAPAAQVSAASKSAPPKKA